MLNKSHLLSRYKSNSGENLKKCLMHFNPDAKGLNPWQLPQDATL